jgi:hypothetical protein
MKFTKTKMLLSLIVCFVLLLFALASPPPATAAANSQPNFYENVMTNGTAMLTNAQTLTVAAKPFTLRQGCGLSVLPYFTGTNTSTADTVFRFEVTADGTSYTTTGPLRVTNSLNSATGVRGVRFLSRNDLDNIRAVKLVSIQNYHTNSIYVTNCVLSQSNQ